MSIAMGTPMNDQHDSLPSSNASSGKGGIAPTPRSPDEPHLRERVARLIGAPDSFDARAALAALEIEDGDIDALGAVSTAHHTRFELLSTPNVLVVLIVWLPGQYGPAHDHGGAACVFRVVRGTARERRYERIDGPPGADERHRVVLVEEDDFVAGAIVSCDGQDNHALGNPGADGQRLVTVHVYRPAPVMREYEIHGEDRP
jgi:hypothetical protein